VVPRLKIPFLIGKYMKGTHLDDEKCQKYITYTRARVVELEAPEVMEISVDGELVAGQHFVIEDLEKAIRFVIPKQ
jgi:diacylglycerol kinase family enzyme